MSRTASNAAHRLWFGLVMYQSLTRQHATFVACRYGSGLTGQQAVMQPGVVAALLGVLADGDLQAQTQAAYSTANLLTGETEFLMGC